MDRLQGYKIQGIRTSQEHKKLTKALNYCVSLLHDCKIHPQPIQKICVVDSNRPYWGKCKKRWNWYVVEINRELLRVHIPIIALVQTLLHEFCHAIPNGMHHEGIWKDATNMINQRYGYCIQPTNSLKSICHHTYVTSKHTNNKNKNTNIGETHVRQNSRIGREERCCI